MNWRRVVVRPDSPLRFWCVTAIDMPGGLSEVIDHPALSEITFRRFLTLDPGALHVQVPDLQSFGAGVMKAASDVPDIFIQLGKHYEGVIEDWLSFSAGIPAAEELKKLSEDRLASLLEGFVERYIRYTPILFVPFLVEQLWDRRSPAILGKLSEGALAAATKNGSDDGARLLAAATGASDASNPSEIHEAVRAIAEYSPRRTVAEMKDRAILELAAKAEDDSKAQQLLMSEASVDADQLGEASPETYEAISQALAEYGWLAHWGYPPLHRASTVDDFIDEVRSQVRAGARERLERDESREEQAPELYEALVDSSGLAPDERGVLETINYYAFLRTWRMEMKMRSQFLSIPLFREIERRMSAADANIERDDVFFTVPPELLRFLRGEDGPPRAENRRAGWALRTELDPDDWELLDGESYRRFKPTFLGIIHGKENGRGTFNPTARYVGGKGAGLFRLEAAGVSVPPFFVVTTEAFHAAANTSGSSPSEAHLPRDLENEIVAASEALGTKLAVRSSAAVEDSIEHSWAGRFATHLHVRPDEVVNMVREVWSSLRSEGASAYAARIGINLETVDMAVVVQTMVEAEVSGVMNSSIAPGSPAVEIEALLGYGPAIVDGEITPDRYVVDPTAAEPIVESKPTKQTRLLTEDGYQDLPAPISEPKISRDHLLELAEIGKRLEREFGGPQDVEFSIAGGEVVILQARALTGMERAASGEEGEAPVGAVFVSGLRGKVASVHEGVAQVSQDLDAAKTEFNDGNVLVVRAATPAWDPITFRSSALVTDEGGATSHAIRVANELGIPAVVGTGAGTEEVPDQETVVIDTASDPMRGRVHGASG